MSIPMYSTVNHYHEQLSVEEHNIAEKLRAFAAAQRNLLLTELDWPPLPPPNGKSNAEPSSTILTKSLSPRRGSPLHPSVTAFNPLVGPRSHVLHFYHTAAHTMDKRQDSPLSKELQTDGVQFEKPESLEERTLVHRWERTMSKFTRPCLKCNDDGHVEEAQNHTMTGCRLVDARQRRRIEMDREELEAQTGKVMLIEGWK